MKCPKCEFDFNTLRKNQVWIIQMYHLFLYLKLKSRRQHLIDQLGNRCRPVAAIHAVICISYFSKGSRVRIFFSRYAPKHTAQSVHNARSPSSVWWVMALAVQSRSRKILQFNDIDYVYVWVWHRKLCVWVCTVYMEHALHSLYSHSQFIFIVIIIIINASYRICHTYSIYSACNAPHTSATSTLVHTHSKIHLFASEAWSPPPLPSHNSYQIQ